MDRSDPEARTRREPDEVGLDGARALSLGQWGSAMALVLVVIVWAAWRRMDPGSPFGDSVNPTR